MLQYAIPTHQGLALNFGLQRLTIIELFTIHLIHGAFVVLLETKLGICCTHVS